MLKAHTQHALKQCQIHMYPFTTHSFSHAIFLFFSIIHRDTHMDPKDYRSYDTAIVAVLGSIYSSTIRPSFFKLFFYFRVESVSLSLAVLICDIALILLKKKSPTNSKHVWKKMHNHGSHWKWIGTIFCRCNWKHGQCHYFSLK